jgi:hypothetical protein
MSKSGATTVGQLEAGHPRQRKSGSRALARLQASNGVHQISDLIATLCDMQFDLLEGTISHEKAAAFAHLSGKILKAAELRIRFGSTVLAGHIHKDIQLTETRLLEQPTEEATTHVG